MAEQWYKRIQLNIFVCDKFEAFSRMMYIEVLSYMLTSLAANCFETYTTDVLVVVRAMCFLINTYCLESGSPLYRR